jgi:hypothetical protein
MKYEYNKKCFTFGIIKKIYYSKYDYYVELTNKKIVLLNNINIRDYHYKADIKALNDAFNANNLEDTIIFDNTYD